MLSNWRKRQIGTLVNGLTIRKYRVISVLVVTLSGLLSASVFAGENFVATESPFNALSKSAKHSQHPNLMLADRKRTSPTARRNSSSNPKYKISRSNIDEDEYANSVVVKLRKAVDLDDDFEDVMDILDNVSAGQRAIFSLVLLREQVNNGGFDMYLSNDAGNLVREAREGLQLVDAVEYEKLLDKVLSIFVSNQHSVHNKSVRQNTLSSLPETRRASILDRLDEEFFELEEEELLKDYMGEYIDKNPSEFFSN